MNPAFAQKELSNPQIEESIDSLMKLMSLKEKIGQLNQYSVGPDLTGPGEKSERTQERLNRIINGEVGSVLNMVGVKNTYDLQKIAVEKSRLGIPLIFAYDVIHGYKTIFPIPLGEAASWDLDLMQRTAQVAAKESAASGLQWTFAPMIDISRDARWGRVMEGAGEDPFLGAEIAKARVKGFQGDDLKDQFTIAACAKHFAGYGFAEAGMDYNTVDVSMHTLHNVILPPFKASVEEAGVATVMNAFNEIGGVPSTANHYLVQQLLKKQWDFEGLVVSDWNSIGELIQHGVAKDHAQAARLAIQAGSDIDMEADAYIEHLEELIKAGKVDEKHIDESVRRVLRLKFALGLFDDPYQYFDAEREKNNTLTTEHLKIAREAARKSIVLLKNDTNLLPLKKSGKIALIGPLATDKDTPIGNWRAQGTANSAVSLKEGLENALQGKATLTYTEGCKLSIGQNTFAFEVEIEQKDRSGFAEAIENAKNADVVIMALGEPAYMSGEARSRSQIDLPGLQLELLKEIKKVNDQIILVLMNGRPLTIPWEAENIPAILEAWHLGTEAGNGIADVIFGDYNPSGKLPMSFPRNVGQCPIYYNYKSSGRPVTPQGMVFYVHHMDVDRTPLFPFGYGLSYTTFEYGDIQLDKKIIKPGESLKAQLTLRNTGKVPGEETVQLYIRDLIATVTRPVKELKAFQKVTLQPGESKIITFELTENDLKFYNHQMEFVSEAGEFELMIGSNSADIQKVTFELDK